MASMLCKMTLCTPCSSMLTFAGTVNICASSRLKTASIALLLARSCANCSPRKFWPRLTTGGQSSMKTWPRGTQWDSQAICLRRVMFVQGLGQILSSIVSMRASSGSISCLRPGGWGVIDLPSSSRNRGLRPLSNA